MTFNLVLLQVGVNSTQEQQVYFHTQARPACMPQLNVCLSGKQSSTAEPGSEGDARLLQLQGHCLCGAGQGKPPISHAPQDVLFCSNCPQLAECRSLHLARCTHHSTGQPGPSGWQPADHCGSPAGPSAVHRQPHHPSGGLLSPAEASSMLLPPVLCCGQVEG